MLDAFRAYARKAADRKLEKTIKSQLDRLASIAASGKRNEEETRRWILDVLRDGLGYKDGDIETESRMLGKRADIALKLAGQIFMVIECKAASVNLTKSATQQACAYAISVGADWAVVTNGQRWRLFHVSPTQGVEPDVTELFDLALFDEDGVSTDDIFCLSLLSPTAIHSGRTRELYHSLNSLSTRRIRDEFLHPEVCKVIAARMQARYKRNMGVDVEISGEEIYELVAPMFENQIAFFEAKEV